ncbi:MAG: hypothetical protein CL968_04745 [Euryarchaeota archaeon]|nr:hypothetical protein [Euryarchaeota archaeon]
MAAVAGDIGVLICLCQVLMVLNMELLLVAGDMGLVVVEAFSMLLTFTPSQGGVFYCLSRAGNTSDSHV